MPNQIRHVARMNGPKEWIDVGFESNVDEVELRFSLVKDAIKDMAHCTREQINCLFDSLCRSIRAAKWEYSNILDVYGPRYEDHGHRFVELIEEIARKVEEQADLRPEVRASLQRHAKEAREMLCEHREIVH